MSLFYLTSGIEVCVEMYIVLSCVAFYFLFGFFLGGGGGALDRISADLCQLVDLTALT